MRTLSLLRFRTAVATVLFISLFANEIVCANALPETNGTTIRSSEADPAAANPLPTLPPGFPDNASEQLHRLQVTIARIRGFNDLTHLGYDVLQSDASTVNTFIDSTQYLTTITSEVTKKILAGNLLAAFDGCIGWIGVAWISHRFMLDVVGEGMSIPEAATWAMCRYGVSSLVVKGLKNPGTALALAKKAGVVVISNAYIVGPVASVAVLAYAQRAVYNQVLANEEKQLFQEYSYYYKQKMGSRQYASIVNRTLTEWEPILNNIFDKHRSALLNALEQKNYDAIKQAMADVRKDLDREYDLYVNAFWQDDEGRINATADLTYERGRHPIGKARTYDPQSPLFRPMVSNINQYAKAKLHNETLKPIFNRIIQEQREKQMQEWLELDAAIVKFLLSEYTVSVRVEIRGQDTHQKPARVGTYPARQHLKPVRVDGLRVQIENKANLPEFEGYTDGNGQCKITHPLWKFLQAEPTGKIIVSGIGEDGQGTLEGSFKLEHLDQREVEVVLQIDDEDIENSIFILIDASGSMRGGKIAAAKSTAIREIARLGPETELAILAFSGNNVSIPFTTMNPEGCARAIAAVENITASGGTPLAASIRRAGGILRRARGKKLFLIILSDGEETAGGDPPAEIQRLNDISVSW